MTILWDTDANAAERLVLALGGDLRTADTSAQVLRTLADVADDLVIIGPDIAQDAACELSELLRVEHPHVGVILQRRRLDVTILAAALRAGVREVVATEDLPALAEAARRSREISSKVAGSTADGRERDGRVVTVFSAKGGVGKTTFSTNLGTYLASTGSKVLVVDLDLAFGDVAISLQILPQRSMIDVVGMAGTLDEQGIRASVTTHSSGLDVICAPSEPSDADRIPATAVSELLRVAKRHYDFVIVDTPPAFTTHVLAAFDLSDQLVLIATLDIPAVKNLRLALDTLDLLGTPQESRLIVLNRSDAKVGLKPEDVVTALKQDIAVSVPNSSSVPATVNRGVSIVLDEPKHPVSVALRELAEKHVRGAVKVSPSAAPSEDDLQTTRVRRQRWSLTGKGARR